ncbi:60S ribosomal protein L24 [Geranomyces variabilis]|uniref:60S ribosomal protein L24 n=1 Tax=Geranomyces variabilis TaxID=109894 RepID=A0AAD5XRC3_9FUNG|nr:60S ribosomal protein L24 [Geranomyces variabilis]
MGLVECATAFNRADRLTPDGYRRPSVAESFDDLGWTAAEETLVGTELCNFSGFKIYPGHGKVFVKGDSRTFRFINGKCESYFMQRLKPSKLDWTVVFRRLHKKGMTEEAAKKRTKRTVKAQRAVVGASLDAIKAKRTQKPEARAAARQQALRQAKEKKADTEQKRKAEKAKSAATTRTAQPKAKFSKQAAKGVAAKPKATSR